MGAHKHPLLGFRNWYISGDHLRASTLDFKWQPGINYAFCDGGDHESPGKTCHCGFNAYYRLEDTNYGGICGAIAGAGRIQLHKEGFRSSEAQVIALYINSIDLYVYSESQIEAIGKFYGVPVFSDEKKFIKYAKSKAKTIDSTGNLFSRIKRKIHNQSLDRNRYLKLRYKFLFGSLLIGLYVFLGWLNYFISSSFQSHWAFLGVFLIFSAIYAGIGFKLFRYVDRSNLDYDFLFLIFLISMLGSCFGVFAAMCIGIIDSDALSKQNGQTITISLDRSGEEQEIKQLFSPEQSDLGFMAFLQIKYKQTYGDYTSIDDLKNKVFPGEKVSFDIQTEPTEQGLLMKTGDDSILLPDKIGDKITTSCGGEDSDCIFDLSAGNELIASSFLGQLMASYGTKFDISIPLSCLNGGETLFIRANKNSSDASEDAYRVNPVCLR